MIPRVAAGDLSASVEIARIEKAEKTAAIIKENNPNIKLVRVQLNKENGRLAQIIFETKHKHQTAAIADVSGSINAGNFDFDGDFTTRQNCKTERRIRLIKFGF